MRKRGMEGRRVKREEGGGGERAEVRELVLGAGVGGVEKGMEVRRVRREEGREREGGSEGITVRSWSGRWRENKRGREGGDKLIIA